MTNRPIKIGDFLLRKKDIITVQDGEKYRRITIRMNKLGVLQRDEVMGVDIGTKKQYVVQGGEFILSKIDSRNGAFGIVPASLKGAIITGDFLAYDINTELVDMDFFLAFISLNNFEKICAQASSGTTNRQRLSEPKFLNFEIQIPATIGEQKDMMKKYFEYKKGFSELKNISDNNEKLIKSLRSSILQDAIQGKLVPQDPSDESASILIEKIQAEKTRLIAEGRIKKQKPLAPIKPEEIPYELPNGWEWVRLEELCEIITKGSSPTWQGVSYSTSGVLFITSENVGIKEVNLKNKKYVELKFNEIEPKSVLKYGDILMNIVGASIGRTAIFKLNELANINQAVCIIRLINILEKEYFLNFFNSSLCLSYMLSKQVNNARENLSMGNIAKFLIPLPPLQEQNRIIEKINELMKSCEFLDEQMKQAKGRSEKLMESVLQGVLNG